ncbi:MAG: branched-chain amino acid ABC transporter permease [Chloroflexi bacterium]|nr:branched-chain amino acid ABC transporter permease [Chloroflexota bacterium]
MNWQLLPQFAITGLLNGGPIALIALGLVLIFKSSEIFNFSQGQMLLFGTMATWWFAAEEGGLGLPLPLAIAAALLTSVLLGMLIERLALRPLTGQPLLSILLMTLALAQVLQAVVVLLFGTVQRNFPVIFNAAAPYRIGLPFRNPNAAADAVCRLAFGDDAAAQAANCTILILKQNLVWSFVVAMIAVFLLWIFFQYTNAGLAMRATAENHETAQAVGIRINRVFATSWGIAGIIATLGGILIATASGLDSSLPIVVLSAFPAVLLGGLESIPGAIIGGLIIGLSQGLVALPNDQFFLGKDSAALIRTATPIVPYLILLIVLVFRPDGLFGQKRIERI